MLATFLGEDADIWCLFVKAKIALNMFNMSHYRLNFSTPSSTNAVSICHSVGLKMISRIEASVRYQISFTVIKPSRDLEDKILSCLHDRMTQCRYREPIKSFHLDVQAEPVYDVDILGEGKEALIKANKKLGKFRI